MAVDFSIIGKRIKEARKKKGLTQEQLVEKMGVSIAYLSKVETGKIHINLERLSEICGISSAVRSEFVLERNAFNSSVLITSLPYVLFIFSVYAPHQNGRSEIAFKIVN